MNKLRLFFLFLLYYGTLNSLVFAEVVTDGSLGAALQLSGPDYAIGADLGQQQGNNLFHSFQSFNLEATESAIFSGAETVENIVSRVTGGNSSFIDGVLGSDISGANLYFLNPAGLMFGPNAALDLTGSFHASTADALHFADGEQFQATNPEQSQFSSAAPSAFGFFDDSPAALSIDGSDLILPTRQTLSFISGDLSINNDSFLVARSGRINLASVSGSGEVLMQENDLVMNAPGGNIHIHRTKLNIESSTLSPAGGALYARAADITLNESGISSTTITLAGKDIDIQADRVNIENGTLITTTSTGGGQSGSIRITATERISASGVAQAAFDPNSQGRFTINPGNAPSIKANAGIPGFLLSGDAGEITLQAPVIELKDGASLGTNSYTPAAGGTINLIAEQSLSISGENDLVTTSVSSNASSRGNAGNINIQAGQFELLNGANISTEAQSSGLGGDIFIQADSINIAGLDSFGFGSFIAANASGTAPNAGAGGTVTLNANNIHFSDGAQVANATFGPAPGGDIIVNATENLVFEGKDASDPDFPYLSGLNSAVQAEDTATGLGGNIDITAGHLQVLDGAELTVGTFSFGNGGNMNITAQQVTMDTGGFITGLSDGLGDAGNITMNLSGVMNLNNGAEISTKANGANGGSLEINSSHYVYAQNSAMTTSVMAPDGLSSGNGGNIILNPEFVVQKNTPIIARAEKGSGGDILINTTGIYKFQPKLANPIDASSRFGVDGVVEINSPDVNVTEAVLAVSTDFLDGDIVLQTPCAKRSEPSSRFILKERQGVPNRQGDWTPTGIILD